jgi:hypothetical protein
MVFSFNPFVLILKPFKIGGMYTVSSKATVHYTFVEARKLVIQLTEYKNETL